MDKIYSDYKYKYVRIVLCTVSPINNITQMQLNTIGVGIEQQEIAKQDKI